MVGRNQLLVATLCALLLACGKSKKNGSGAGDSDATAASSTTSGGSGGTGGSSVGGSGGEATTGGAGGVGGTGGSGGSGGEPLAEDTGWRLDEFAGCLTGERETFTSTEPLCGQAPSVQRDTDGQCWWFANWCYFDDLTPDSTCGSADEQPPFCGEGGSAGQGGQANGE